MEEGGEEMCDSLGVLLVRIVVSHTHYSVHPSLPPSLLQALKLQADIVITPVVQQLLSHTPPIPPSPSLLPSLPPSTQALKLQADIVITPVVQQILLGAFPLVDGQVRSFAPPSFPPSLLQTSDSSTRILSFAF